MRKVLLVAAATLGLGACAYPDTKMVPVEPTASQQSTDSAAPAANDATSTKPASGKSAAATR
jgi:hypothetical protein